MNRSLSIFLGVLVISMLMAVSAEAQTNLVSVSPVPTNGVFWSLQDNNPPMPYDPFPSLPLYMEEGVPGVYYYDTTGYGGGWSMDDPPSPGGLGGSGSPEEGGVTNPPLPNFTLIGPQDYAAFTNLYLAITNVGSNTYVTLGSTLSNLTYVVLTNDNLADSNGWEIYTNILATNNVTPLPPMDLGTNTLFFNAALVWCTCPNPSALPDWESMLYYNSLCVPASGGYITNGLVAYWRLNDGSGDAAADSSGNGLTLPLINNPTWTSNYYLNFNGSNQYGDISGTNALLNTLDTNNVTVCAWINKTSSSQKGIVNKFSYNPPTYKGWSFQVTADNRLDWFIDSGNDDTDSGPGVIPLGQWIFVAATWSVAESQVSYYINGILNSTNTPSASESISGGADLQVGNVLLPLTNDFCFDGSIRDVAVYNRALSSNEILTNFLYSEPCTNVILPDSLYYKMLNAGQTNNPLTMTNFATDDSSNGAMILIGGNPVEWMAGLGTNSNGLHFNGSYSYLDTSNAVDFNFTTNLFTINFWIHPDSGPSRYIMQNGFEASNGWYVELGGSYQIYFGTESNGVDQGVLTVAGAAQNTNWDMITIVRTETTNAMIYINGLLETNGPIISPAPSTNHLIFGVDATFNADYFLDGDLWLPQIWRTNLSAIDIANLHFNQKSGSPWPTNSELSQ